MGLSRAAPSSTICQLDPQLRSMADDFFAFLVKELEEFENIYNELILKSLKQEDDKILKKEVEPINIPIIRVDKVKPEPPPKPKLMKVKPKTFPKPRIPPKPIPVQTITYQESELGREV